MNATSLGSSTQKPADLRVPFMTLPELGGRRLMLAFQGRDEVPGRIKRDGQALATTEAQIPAEGDAVPEPDGFRKTASGSFEAPRSTRLVVLFTLGRSAQSYLWGYILEGEPEPPESYLRYCMSDCDWSTFRYREQSRTEMRAALAKLVASSKWRRPLEKQERERLTKQID